MGEQLQAIATLLSLVNPAICAAMFSNAEMGRDIKAKVADGIKASIAILVILCLAALFGAKVLNAFGVSLDAFKVAGGGVLAWMGFAMLGGGSDSKHAQVKTDGDDPAAKDHPAGNDASLTPLIMFAASPGTITGVITLAVAHSRTDVPITTLIAIAVAVAVTLLVMLALSSVGGKNQDGFVRSTVTRFMGLIVIAMGVQFALEGFKAFMA
jgi:multiple antibiotic resistance protein